jgi:hypothetical protein
MTSTSLEALREDLLEKEFSFNRSMDDIELEHFDMGAYVSNFKHSIKYKGKGIYVPCKEIPELRAVVEEVLEIKRSPLYEALK